MVRQPGRSLGLDLCGGRASLDTTEAGAGLGRAHRSDGHPLAQGRQKCRWRAGVALAGGPVRALVGLNVAQELSLAADGGVPQRERGGAALSRAAGRQSCSQIRDHSSIARAEAALGAEGKAAVNAVVIKTAQQLQFTDGKTLSSDTTVQEPAIGYPNEPGILKGWAERIERGLEEAQSAGRAGGARGDRESPGGLPERQTPSSVCQNESGEEEASRRDRQAERRADREDAGRAPAGECPLRASQTARRRQLETHWWQWPTPCSRRSSTG